MHRQGAAQTSLTDIATEAQVPVGSLYYYFKSKDDIVRAIVDERVRTLQEMISQWNRHEAPLRRLDALIDVWVKDRDVDARYGCPIGSLCYELGKEGGPMRQKAAQPLRLLLDWSEQQFLGMGQTPAAARNCALHLITVLQGISLVSNAFGDPQMTMRETRRLRAWLRDL